MRRARFLWAAVFSLLICSTVRAGSEPFGPLVRLTRDRLLDPAVSEAGARLWLRAGEAARHAAVRSGERTDNCPHDFDVQHYRIDLSIDFAGQTITGDTRVRAVSEVPSLSQITLDLAVLTVDGVFLDGAPLTWQRVDPFLAITLDRAYAAGDTFEVQVLYHGHPGNEGASGFGGFYFNTSAGIAYQMAVGLVADPPSMGKYWFPGWDWPCDKATAEYHITVPDGKIAVCNGVLVSSRVDPVTRNVTWSWSETHQISPHVMSVAACGYTELVDATYDWIHYWVYPTQVGNAATHFSNVHTMMDAFISRYGPYPFSKFGYCSAPKGDMEHQTCVTHLAATVQPNHVYDWLLAHEMSHQWWGDCVSVNDWRDVWLSEGFATYSEAIFQEYANGFAAYQSYMQSSLMTPVFNSSENFPIYDPVYLWGTTVYEKGGTVLHMLRHVVGDEDFFAALAAYRAAHEHGNAVTAQFQAIVEDVSGMDLDWFFQEWIHDVGWPEYQYQWNARYDGLGFHLDLSIDQTQTNGPVYTMPVDVKITTAAGDTLVTLWVDSAHELFTVDLPASPTGVVLDPDNWILNRATEVPSAGVPEEVASGLATLQARPSPFRESTRIEWQGEPAMPVRIEILDPAGRRVRTLWDGRWPGGAKALEWDGRDAAGAPVSAGAYFVRLQAAAGERSLRIARLR